MTEKKEQVTILKEAEDLKSVTGYELMEKTRELHSKIMELVVESDLPIALVIAVLENVKETIHKFVDHVGYLQMLANLEKKREGGDR